jgi:hypothetical protein
LNETKSPLMIKRILLFVVAFNLCSGVIAQGEADKWYFGVLGGLDFTGGTPVAISGSLNSSEGTAAISSAGGNLLFYTDGVSVWDSTDAVMPNGSGLTGDISSTQSAIIVPSLTFSNQYYIFTTAADGGPAGCRYSIVNMGLNGGLGDVTASKNIPVTDSVTEKLCAVRDASNTGYWIMIHKWGSNKFYAYHLTASGLSAPVISAVGSVHTASPTAFQNTYGQMKFNMCGDKLALAMGYLNTVELFDFDNSTGAVSNPITLPMGYHVYGVEFSKNSGLLYVTSYDPSSTLNQFNISLITQPLIAASKVSLSNMSDLYGLQIGPDSKIYVAESFSSPFVGVINSPDTYGTGANFVDNAIVIDPMGNGVMCALSFPSFLQDYLKVNVTCSVGITEIETEENVLIYPNPASEFTVRFREKFPLLISVYDHTGRLIEEHLPKTDQYVFGKEYAPGMYFVSCISSDQIKTYKVIKN